MSYNLYPEEGIVVRVRDSKQVVPAQSINDQDYLEYINWINEGHYPKICNNSIESVHCKKVARVDKISKLIITTECGNSYNADEASQNRLMRAILSIPANSVIPWVLADNTMAYVNKLELEEALRIAYQETAKIWVDPYI
jgi:hypothetical protein